MLLRRASSSEEERMHNIFFVAKRAHWGMQNTMRKPLKKKFNITAARVDMLHVIAKDEWPEQREQRRLVTMLGCVRSVVSRMLKAMEALGWVSREKADYDRRLKLVSLTKLGRRMLDRVQRSYIRSGLAAVWTYKALAGHSWRKKGRRFECVLWNEAYLQWMREGFRGGGRIELYPFGHPDA
jgi:DNA-binding MarR family transcriptional regulator